MHLIGGTVSFSLHLLHSCKLCHLRLIENDKVAVHIKIGNMRLDPITTQQAKYDQILIVSFVKWCNCSWLWPNITKYYQILPNVIKYDQILIVSFLKGCNCSWLWPFGNFTWQLHWWSGRPGLKCFGGQICFNKAKNIYESKDKITNNTWLMFTRHSVSWKMYATHWTPSLDVTRTPSGQRRTPGGELSPNDWALHLNIWTCCIWRCDFVFKVLVSSRLHWFAGYRIWSTGIASKK